jgi:putative transposase
MAICGVKYRAYPTNTQANILSQWIGCARVIYNCKVEEDQHNYRYFKETGQKTPVHQAYSQFKTAERPWLKEVPSQLLRNSASNWYQAKQRVFKGLANNPRKKHKGQKDTVLLTRELFSLTEKVTSNGDVNKILKIGTKRHDLGNLKVIYHRECGQPKQIVISKKQDCWYVSFCYETGKDILSEEAILASYSEMSKSELDAITIGIDRGIAIPFQVSNDTAFNFDEATQLRLQKKAKRLKRYQRKMANQQLTSVSRKLVQKKVGKVHKKIANIRHDFCHKTSHALANSTACVFAIENLSLKNMTKAPKPKLANDGHYLPNKRKAKAGLNRELLSKGLAKTIDLLAYKARNAGKCVVYVSPYHSSQECAACSHTHPDNRKTQAVFSCLSCGNQDNADANAAKVIKKRGIQYLLSKPTLKTKIRLGTSRSNAGRGTCKTMEVCVASAQVLMTSEALPL